MSSSDLRGLITHAGANDAWYEDPHLPGRPLLLRAARPERYSPATPLLFAHHGDLRNGGDYRDHWLPLVDEAKIFVVVPEFSAASYPGPAWYNLGNRVDENDRTKPREEWTYGVPARVFASLLRQGVTARGGYGLFGHSSGGQFVHRTISLGFRDGVALAATANAGSYAMPDLEIAFPHGLGGTDIDEAELRALLAFWLMVFAGTADTDTTSEHFPRDDAAMRQGPTRYARAHAYIATARDAARRLGMSCAWTIIDVPKVGHDGAQMSSAAAAILSATLHGSQQ